jgi:hypothetical protein
MHIDRCFFLNEVDHIKAVEIIESEAIGEAIEKLSAMLLGNAQHQKIEIWEGGRRLYRGEKQASGEGAYERWLGHGR